MSAPAAPLFFAALTLWHAYQGEERAALERAIAEENALFRASERIEPLAIPFDAFARKLETAAPRGHGPDLFIAAHDRLGDWRRAGVVAGLGPPGPRDHRGEDAPLFDAFTVEGELYAVPVGFKALFLYWNRALLPDGPPADARELFTLAARLRPRGAAALAYDAGSFFFHAPFFFAFGGALFDGDRVAVFDEPGARSFAYVKRLSDAGAIPRETSSRIALELFNHDRAALVLSGPWFAGDVTLPRERWGIAPLFSVEGRPAGSFVSVEGVFARERALRPAAERLARALRKARAADPLAAEIERAQWPALRHGALTPARPEMSLVWEPAGGLLRDLLERGVSFETALDRAKHALAVLLKPAPSPAPPAPYLALASAILLALALFGARRAAQGRMFARVRRSAHAYVFALPAFFAMLALSVAPFLAGAAVSLFSYSGKERTFVGLRNFSAILFARDFPITDPLSFYYTLGVTILWTVLNVALHVAIGGALALLLRSPWLRLRSVYRVILVLPWAVPSYITALAWRGLFDFELGAIDRILRALGFEPVSFFAQFSTAFAANLATNVWLGFPFMLVVTLGALQSIPPELEEAAALEGATRWQRLRMVTLPAIRPAIAPAIVLGCVWTFNSFNVIYLVSGGEPAGKTEILISQAYKWAFARNHQYGYAAAYAVIIFLVLLAGSRVFGPKGEAEP